MLKSYINIFIGIAGFTIQINFYLEDQFPFHIQLLNDIKKKYKSFIITNVARTDYIIDLIPKRTIILIKNRSGKYYINFFRRIKTNKIEACSNISFSQFEYLIKIILYKLLSKNGLLIHASAVRSKNGAIAFLGPSGAGKSTIITLLRKIYPALADDSAILKMENRKLYFYQTPFYEKNYWFEKTSYRYTINKIFFLKKAKFLNMKKVNQKETIVSIFIKQLFLEENNGRAIKKIFQFISKIDCFYFLYFQKNKRKLLSYFQNNAE